MQNNYLKNIFRIISVVMSLWQGMSAHGQLVANFSATPTSGCLPMVVNFTDLSTGSPAFWKWDLGNGTTSILQNPAVTYFVPGQYSIKLVVRNSSGSDSITKLQYINVNATPTVNFIGTPLTGCFPLVVHFTDLSLAGSGNISTHEWDFGDGNTSSLPNPQHTYTSSGNFNVSLRIVNSLGCNKTLTKTNYVVVNTGVHANFSQIVPNSCNPPVTVNFQNLSTGLGVLNYQWSFGDGGNSTATNPSHTYISGGSYTVTLIVTNVNGCSDTLVRNNTVTVGTVTANFTMPDTICAGVTVPIVNTSNPVPSGVLWNFGDGSSSTLYTPAKVFSTPGSYIVKLVDNFGACSDSISRSITILPNPVIIFSASDTASCKAPFTVNFTSTITGATGFLWTFGDGTSSTQSNPTHTYNQSGNYDVTLIAVNAAGCTDTLKKHSYIKIDGPHILLLGLPVKGCAPLSNSFNPSIISVDPVVSYLWDFGDGSTSTIANPTHTWNNPGVYTVKLKITTLGGCSDSSTLLNGVRVGVKPIPSFNANPRDACARYSINFNDLSTGNPDQWLWRFGDGDTSILANPSHKYNDTGYFTITLIVWNNGCADSITFPNFIHIKPPIAKFVTGFSCSNPLYRQFFDNSVGADEWNWDFGDGTSSTIRNPSHTYLSPGTYAVSLAVTNYVTGCSDTLTSQVVVLNDHADFIASDTIICRGSFAFFHTVNINSSNISSYTWKFGDGSILTDTLGLASHRYLSSGRYTVSLIILNKLGCSDTLVKSLYIYAGAPTALFRSATNGTCISTPVTFIDSSYSDGVHPINQWAWDYGDGSTQLLTTPPFQHSYSSAGIYSVRLKVIDSYGCTDSIRRLNYIIVSKPIASFVSNDTVSCPNKPVMFNNQSTGPGLVYHWNFGDGTTSASLNPIHQYLSDGLYTVSLKITDQYGCTDSLARQSYINILSPHAQFTMSDSVSTCPPLVVNFTNQSLNYVSLHWDFGDGTTSNLDSPTHFYSSPGLYNVKLLVTSRGGCIDQKVKQVNVSGPRGSLSYNNILGCAPLQTNFHAITQDHLTFIWDFNDGTTISTPDSTISHIYTNPGVYLPKLILVDPNGCQVPIVGNDSINVYGVLAKYVIENGTVCDSGFVHFINTSIVNGIIQSYYWSFGDGTSSTSSSPAIHYYSTPGIYQTYLILTTQSCADTAQGPVPVKIVTSPKTRIGGDSASCVPAYLDFLGEMVVKDTSLISWRWTFGNGHVSTLQDPDVQVYTVAGSYNVNSIATNSSGCKDSVNKIIQVYPLPDVAIAPVNYICHAQSATLFATGASTYTWSPTIGLSCSNCANPSASPDSSTRYVVTGTSNFGCEASDTTLLSVKQPFIMSVGFPDTLCVGKSTRLLASGADLYSWEPAVGLNNPSIANPVAQPVQSTNYRVIGSDHFGCFMDTGYIRIAVYPIPVVNAGADKTINVGQSVTITPTISSDVTSAIWTPSTGIASYHFPSIVARPNVTTEYNVLVTNQGHCKSEDKVTIFVICNNANIFIPNTFSPNGDGANDVFYIRGSGVFQIKTFRIFNRWGEVVFEAANINPNDASKGWDGTYKGKKLTPDVFIYTADVICDNNSLLSYQGNVTLIK